MAFVFLQQTANFWTPLTDTSMDSELRIAAYLALMQCPNHQTLDRVATVLETMEDENVASFMYSHLKNLGETSDPHKQDLAIAINK